ncbi:hypothetical protein PoB_006384500 [Plakobranchus ocellatus]|uniref:Uncharacterized protein n=1 Tax=Plakobranchus ocellatus TaxID=259542 RepID=A0AAV4CZV2_9GAST|nr:hypothetical protein PoB_006384500 [Plakobranchus ocellatus]
MIFQKKRTAVTKPVKQAIKNLDKGADCVTALSAERRSFENSLLENPDSKLAGYSTTQWSKKGQTSPGWPELFRLTQVKNRGLTTPYWARDGLGNTDRTSSLDTAPNMTKADTAEISPDMTEANTAEISPDMTEADTAEISPDMTEVDTAEISPDIFEIVRYIAQIATNMAETNTSIEGTQTYGTETSIISFLNVKLHKIKPSGRPRNIQNFTRRNKRHKMEKNNLQETENLPVPPSTDQNDPPGSLPDCKQTLTEQCMTRH